MQEQLRRNRLIAIFLGVSLFAFAGWVGADPPTRVARLGYVDGAVSFSPAGESDWVRATVNRPLVTGDRLWADAGARAELQVGSAVIRMGGRTSLTVLNLDDNAIQVQLAQGTLNLRVRRFAPDDVLEVDTPNLAFSIRQSGDYKIDVDSTGDATMVATRSGRADVFGEGAAYVVDAQRAYRFAGTGLRDYAVVGLPPMDDFDRWASDRDRRWESSATARYVSPDVIGYQDLDDNGTWRADARYGNVWVPNRVSAGWAPYHDGHWAWIDPWGWTWVDDAPWGFAVSHYGRWTDLGGTWGWVPGPVRAKAVYAPALVAFVGGRNFQLAIASGNVGGVAWFPLGPRDVYRPAYAASRGYFNNINTSNTVINNTQITNVYNNTSVTNVTYVNQRVPGAVIAVPATAFVQSQPVSKVAVRMSSEMAINAPVAQVAAVAPVRASVIGAAAPAGSKPPAAAMERATIAKRAPPAASVGFASKERLLAANPGKPLDAEAMRALKPALPAEAPKVQVIAPAQSARPIAAPTEVRGKSDERGKAAEPPVAAPVARPAPAVAVPPAAAPPAATPPVAAPPAATPPVAVPPEPRGKSEERRKAAEPPVAAPVTRPAPPVAAPPVAAPPTATPPVAAPPDQRAKPEQRGKAAEPPVAAPVARPAPPAVAPPAAVPPVAAPAVRPPPPGVAPPITAPPVIAPSDPRGKSEERRKAAEPPFAAPAARPAPPVAAPPATVPPVPAPMARPAPPVAAPPVAVPPAPVPPGATLPDQRGKAPKADDAKSGSKKSDEQLKLEDEEKKRKAP